MAEQDLQGIIDNYLLESGIILAEPFQKAWSRTIRHRTDFPDSGSPRLAKEVGIRSLRIWPVQGFPHLAACVVATDVTTVIRVLHTARDIPSSQRD